MASGLQYVQLGKQLGLVDEELRKYVDDQVKQDHENEREERRANREAEQKKREIEQRNLEAEREERQRNLEAEREERQRSQAMEHELAMKKLELELEAMNRRAEKANTVTSNVAECPEHLTYAHKLCVNKSVDPDRVHLVEDEQERIPGPISKAADSAEAHALFNQHDEDASQGCIEEEMQMCDKEESASATQQATKQNATPETMTVGQQAELSQELVNVQLHSVEGGETVSSNQTTEKSTVTRTVVAPTSESNVSSPFTRLPSFLPTRQQMKQQMQSGNEFAQSSFRDSKPCRYQGDFHTWFRCRRKQGKGNERKHWIGKAISSASKSFDFRMALMSCGNICVRLREIFLFEENLLLKTGLCHKYSRV